MPVTVFGATKINILAIFYKPPSPYIPFYANPWSGRTDVPHGWAKTRLLRSPTVVVRNFAKVPKNATRNIQFCLHFLGINFTPFYPACEICHPHELWTHNKFHCVWSIHSCTWKLRRTCKLHLRSEKKITNGLLVVTRGRATLNYTPKRNPTVKKLLTKPHATDLKQDAEGFLYIMEIRNINEFMPWSKLRLSLCQFSRYLCLLNNF